MAARGSGELDCTRCGACCANPDENRAERFVDYVEVRRSEPLLAKPKLAQRFVVYNAEGVAHLRLDESGKCLALRGKIGRRVSCTIYEDRPLGCRKVEAGSERCLAYRRERQVR
ncbi:MAG TPA: YkgJ family cysteine cluster protein [Polyangiaceae bacterium]|nr:YkgJ family cysteine cluster protein [Polyangiaceae bacterium]